MISTTLFLISVLVPMQDEDGVKKPYKPKVGEKATVQNCKAGLRKRTKLLADPFETVKRGTTVIVDEVKSAWIKVTVPKTKDHPKASSGYMRTQNVMAARKYDQTEGKFVIDPDNPNTFVSSPDSGGASTKGFTPEVEAQRRKDNTTLDLAYRQLESVQYQFPGGKDRSINQKMVDLLKAFRKAGNLDK